MSIKTLSLPVVSVDSVMAEYSHLKEFKKMGAKAIEMETATFFQSINLIKKKASALLVISDNSTCGEHLLGKTEEQLKKYHKSKGLVCEILTNL